MAMTESGMVDSELNRQFVATGVPESVIFGATAFGIGMSALLDVPLSNRLR